jgi:hypothetical protein
MMTQSNRVLARLTNRPWISAHFNKLAHLARKKILNYVSDLSLLTSVWLARYMVWREMRRRRRQS